jgi:hypothetical protein
MWTPNLPGRGHSVPPERPGGFSRHGVSDILQKNIWEGAIRIIDFRCRPNTAEYLSAFSDSAATVTGKLGEARSETSTLEAWVAGFESLGIERLGGQAQCRAHRGSSRR